MGASACESSLLAFWLSQPLSARCVFPGCFRFSPAAKTRSSGAVSCPAHTHLGDSLCCFLRYPFFRGGLRHHEMFSERRGAQQGSHERDGVRRRFQIFVEEHRKYHCVSYGTRNPGPHFFYSWTSQEQASEETILFLYCPYYLDFAFGFFRPVLYGDGKDMALFRAAYPHGCGDGGFGPVSGRKILYRRIISGPRGHASRYLRAFCRSFPRVLHLRRAWQKPQNSTPTNSRPGKFVDGKPASARRFIAGQLSEQRGQTVSSRNFLPA